MAEPVSSLAGALGRRTVGAIPSEGPGIRLSERPIGALWQVTAWPDRLDAAGKALANTAKAASAPGPGRSVAGGAATLMRIDPLRWWLLSEGALARPALAATDATLLDLGHARTAIRIEGRDREALVARLVPVDLRSPSFPEGSVASTGCHHVGVTVLAHGEGYDLFVFRTFALSLFEHIAKVAAQFGAEIG